MSCRPPFISPRLLSDFIKKHFPFQSVTEQSIKLLNGYEDRNYQFTGKLKNTTTCKHTTLDAEQFVIKFTNSRDSGIKIVEGLNELTKFLFNRNIVCPCPIPSTLSCGSELVRIKHSDLLPYTDGTNVLECPMSSNGSNTDPYYCVRVFVFIEGELLGYTDHSPKLLYELGCYIGRMNKQMMLFSHAGLGGRQLIEWDLKSLLTRREILPIAVKDPEKNRILTKVLDDFEEHVTPIMKDMVSGVIHNDLNCLNIIAKKDSNNELTISGIIDFNDCIFSPYIFELGIAMTYLMTRKDDPIPYIKPFLQGYLSKFQLSKQSLNVLYYVILGRIAQSYINSAYIYQLEPTNDYILIDAEPMWRLMGILLNEGKDNCYQQWELI